MNEPPLNADLEAFERGISTAQYLLAADFADTILRDIFQGRRDHLRGQMLDVAAKVSRRHPWPYFEKCVEAEVSRRLDERRNPPVQKGAGDDA